MYNKRLLNWVNGNVFCAVEHTGKLNNNLLFSLIAEKKKDTITIAKSLNTKSIEDLIDLIPKNIGINLVINNDLVLSKTIDTSVNHEEAVHLAFPTLKLSEFYYEVVSINQISLVSVCRKNDVNQLLEDYFKKGLQVISFSLGNSSIFEMDEYIKNDAVFSTNTMILFDANGIKKMEFVDTISKSTYSINDIELDNTHLLSFSSILQAISGNINTTYSNFTKLLNEKKDDYVQKRIFQKGVLIGIGIIFSLLIINILLFSTYQSKLRDLEQKNSINQQSKFKLIQLEKEVTDQNKLIDEMLRYAGNHATYMLDDLTANLPMDISLSNIHYQPFTKKIKPNTEIKVKNKVLIVKGLSVSDENFSIWIADLEQKKWVKSVIIRNYGSKNKIPEFTIKIEIKDEW